VSAAAQFIVAMAILAGYGWSLYLMFQHSGKAGSEEWDRMVYLFSGFEAIVFVAAGVIFGTRVQRASVEEARERSRRTDEWFQQAREDADAERERADQTAEAVTVFIKTLKAIQLQLSRQPVPDGNGNGSAAMSGNLAGAYGVNDPSAPTAGGIDLSSIIQLAEEVLPQGRR
jgi:hypothetical protein